MLTFNFHLGDWIKATQHLNRIERDVYLALLIRYYDTEAPLPATSALVYRLAMARSDQDKAAVDAVLEEFFYLDGDGWHSKRADEEIAKFREKSAKASRSASARWTHTETETPAQQTNDESSADAMRTHSEGNANHEPRTTNPIVLLPTQQNGALAPAKKQRATGSRLPKDWALPKDWGNWALLKGLPRERVITEAEKFRNYWVSKSGRDATKLDWEATWQNWVIRSLEKSGDKTFYEKTNQAKERDADKRLSALSSALPEELQQLGLA